MTKDFKYKGFTSPNGTIVPDDVFDVLAPELTEAELRVLLYVVRRTFGFKKNADAISLGQMCNGIKTRDGKVLDRGTGMSRSAVIRGAQGLVEKGILVKKTSQTEDGENETNVYSLHFSDAPTEAVEEENNSENRGVVLQNDYRSLPKNPPQFSKRTTVVLQEDPQQTALQQTERSLSNIRNGTPKNDFVDNSTAQPADPYQSSAVNGDPDPRTTNLSTSDQQSNNGSVADPGTLRQWGMEALADILKRGRGRPSKQEREERQMIEVFIRDFAPEFHDRAKLKSSVTRAFNIYKESGMHPGVFQDCMYQARATTKDYQSRSLIKESPMAYYFRVLEDKSGVKEHPYSPTLPN